MARQTHFDRPVRQAHFDRLSELVELAVEVCIQATRHFLPSMPCERLRALPERMALLFGDKVLVALVLRGVEVQGGGEACGFVAQEIDVVGHADGFMGVVGDEDDAGFAGKGAFADDLLQMAAQVAVEGGKGFVHEEQVGIGDECAGKGNALAHAAGEFVRVFAEIVGVEGEREEEFT